MEIKPARWAEVRKYGLVSLAAFMILAAFTSFYVGGEKVWHELCSINLSVFYSMLLLSLVNYTLRILRWYWCSNHIGVQIPFHETCVFYLSGFAFSTSPVKLGEALRIWFIDKRYQCGISKLIPVFFVDKVSDLHAMLLMCLVCLLMVGQYIKLTLLATAIIVIAVLPLAFKWAWWLKLAATQKSSMTEHA